MEDFSALDMPSFLTDALQKMEIKVPTPVQKETLPLAFEGHDLLVSARTGTGKTMAYLIPLIVKLYENTEGTALIITPTRELASQVHDTILRLIGRKNRFKTALLIGGASGFKQKKDLMKRPRIVVGTPGRIMDHLERESFRADDLKFLVVDEADRMLDMGFGIQLERIVKDLPEERQTLMFSATLPPAMNKLSEKYLTSPRRIAVEASVTSVPKIVQETLYMKSSEKRNRLLAELDRREGSVIIFVKTKKKAEILAEELKDSGHSAISMHGDLPQRRRERVLLSFRQRKNRILVATDIAARGLDIPHVMHVINHDVPECPEDYVHRIGRTGRADAEGFAVSFVAPEEKRKWAAVAGIMKFSLPEDSEKSMKQGRKSNGGRKKPEKSFSSERKKRAFGERRKDSSKRKKSSDKMTFRSQVYVHSRKKNEERSDSGKRSFLKEKRGKGNRKQKDVKKRETKIFS